MHGENKGEGIMVMQQPIKRMALLLIPLFFMFCDKEDYTPISFSPCTTIPLNWFLEVGRKKVWMIPSFNQIK
jgi:hypothetical protein